MRTPAFLLALLFAATTAIKPVNGAILFADDFESGSLAAYTGQGGGIHGGLIDTDPVQGDKALHFSRTIGGGDVFTSGVFSHASGQYFLEFDYFAPSGAAGDGVGFIGVSTGLLR